MCIAIAMIPMTILVPSGEFPLSLFFLNNLLHLFLTSENRIFFPSSNFDLF